MKLRNPFRRLKPYTCRICGLVIQPKGRVTREWKRTTGAELAWFHWVNTHENEKEGE